jgi:primosomal protein N' (replication factor Y)
MKYAQVAVSVPLKNSVLTYSYEDDSLMVGDLVEIPLGRRKAKGCIIEVDYPIGKVDPKWRKKLKNIIGVIDNSIKLRQEEIDLYTWMSKYYHYSLGQLIFDCLPKFLKRPREVKSVQGDNQDFPHVLNPDQQVIYDHINKSLDSGFKKYLIHGVTGSGKTLIYLNLIKQTIDKGQSVLFLLPEINLTPQFIKTFSSYLKCKIHSYHSGVSNSEKYHLWKNLRENDEPFLLMGVRSSVFLHMNNLGLVVVDEEHDHSFKQEDRCPYNARDVAIKKAHMRNITAVIGSATPTVENFHQYKTSNSYFTLTERAGEGHFPKIELIDIRGKFEDTQKSWPLMNESLVKLKEVLAKGEQALIFINKLGFANYVQCRSCGHHFTNEECGCGLNLRYFKAKCLLSCSHCDFKMPVPESCPECGNLNLLQRGFGTERVHEVVQAALPEYNIERFDRDEIKNFEQLNSKLNRFHNNEINVLVGTQMLSKGHNFEKVNLVLILGVDSQLNFSDFRANEKAYQLITQVSGRAGRFSPESKVLIQTLNPDHDIFVHLKSSQFDHFYQDELEMRDIASCPPFKKMAMIYFSARDRNKLMTSINHAATRLEKTIVKSFNEVQLLGPIPSTIEKKANQFTWCMMLKSGNVNQLHSLIKAFEIGEKTDSTISVKIDIDPYTTA